MTSGLALVDAVWPEIDQHEFVLVPVGSTEQHGPHLPFDTDTTIARAVATEAALRLRPTTSVRLAPALSMGSSGEHQSFAGTISIGTEALRIVLVEMVRSLRTWSGPVLFVNAHGGNTQALRSAIGQMQNEGHPVDWVACATENVDLHAGRTETSLMLHLRPDSVRLDRAVSGDNRTLREILPLMMSDGVGAVSPNGVLGDPRGASAPEGAALLTSMVEDAVTVAQRLLASAMSVTR
ncbi:MAG TPA: mycofactocin biosynthesis peptidyl-dipeptidase MftE [Marmoricola sp.]|nr:mycofactocin biosynthesis peptidyl-dipeptidase MftE [Marmoricola sp.]